MIARSPATIEDLYDEPEGAKAEIVGGELVRMSPSGARPGRAAMAIAMRLREYERQRGGGYAFGDNVGFVVSLARRQSFSPDAAWFTGALPDGGLKFLEGAPAFAAEVRSEGDYSARAERQMAEKRADYFAAGTLVVWDVDLLSEGVIRVYRADSPDIAKIYHRGETAEAEPAVPGWTFLVDELFD